MTVVTFVARFPTGEFNAHDADGMPEWPPAPARLLAALLAAAHRTGRGVSAVKVLFEVEPPRIRTPRAGTRDVSFRRWVPVNNELALNRTGDPTGIVDANRRFLEKQGKAPERGVTVGTGPDQVVSWTFDLPGDTGIETLRAVAHAVEYLGRPTSPVVLDVVTGDRAASDVPDGHLRWVPDPTGRDELRVGTPGLLASLNAREEERRRSRVTGSHPVMVDRPTATYRLVGGTPAVVAQRRDVRAWLARCAFYRLDPVHGRSVPAADAGLVCGQLASDLMDGGWVLPVLREAAYRTKAQLTGVLAHGLPVEPGRPVATRIGTARARLVESRSLASLPRVLLTVLEPSRRWTTTVPTSMAPTEVEQWLTAAAEEAAASIVEAGMHVESRTEGAVDANEIAGSRHVTVEWDREVAGPVSLGPYLMVPEWVPGVAVKARRSTRQ